MSNNASIVSAKIKIEFSNLQNKFSNEIDDPHKKRIVFSGAFGSGKTTFLKEYFAQSEQYLPIHIFPVNYVVATNEDIFELIKYDILYKLLDHKPYLDKLDVSNIQALAFLSTEDIIGILTPFVKSINLIDKSIIGVFDSLRILQKKLLKKRGELAKDDVKSIKAFFKTFNITKGSIYEHDFYTELLNSLIKNIETRELGDSPGVRKKLVLIIDDLDRIDPEHIFRILNVFAAHFDVESDQNKFGLSKVILTCDINNIRKIFEHKYGKGVDFNGYINKFYSSGIFNFNNESVVKQAILDIVGSIHFENSIPFANLNVKEGQRVRNYVIYFLQVLIENHKIQIRDLTKFSNTTLAVKRQVVNLKQKIELHQIRTFLAFEYLILFFGDQESLLSALESIEFSPFDLFSRKKGVNRIVLPIDFLGDLILITESHVHQFEEKFHGFSDKDGNNWGTGYSISLQIENLNNYYYNVTPLVNSRGEVVELHNNFSERSDINFRPLIIRALKEYISAPKTFQK